ncbi:molybdopterin cofactor-binding domain-containing protein [Ferrovibrio sp.]|uniref:xanthine dehydrogenase family protein molybdopterin-binding subunit n=1 Tax=Ferrovibrio sp. TaxID=1917215 RepID=UPI001B5828D1|nr:molybdopterin cofactor-binding domain-containing protein [Ferrovibrio sp.]MBP7065974.1 xanthine dehydrogenase family protein molybdopterin-binding subunit [Ferrovibrio sp.]
MASLPDATRALVSRRSVLKGFAAGGLLVGVPLPALAQNQQRVRSVQSFALGIWLHVGVDNRATVLVCQSEMGQGVYTTLPTLVAEELEMPLERIDVRAAPADAIYRNTYLVKAMLAGGHPESLSAPANWLLERMGRIAGQQVTGGSTSVRWLWQPLRLAGARARQQLVQAAAQQLGVPVSECRAEAGHVLHAASNRRLAYGAVAELAASLPAPEEITLKPPESWSLIGKALPRLDTPAKLDGRARFGLDVREPGQLYAALRFAPQLGAKLLRLDDTVALQQPNVKAVLRLDNAFAVVAENSWRAMAACDDVQAEWGPAAQPMLDTAGHWRSYEQALTSGKPDKVQAAGDADAALGKAANVLTAEYRLPLLAHAALEPMNATVRLGRDGYVDVWAPTQAQDAARKAAADATGIDADKVRVHTTLLGGGFGRRAEADFVSLAAQVARQVPGIAVQTLWPREQDMRNDFYRPASLHRVRVGLDAEGNLSSWKQTIACPSIMRRVFPPSRFLGPDETAFEGAHEPAYGIADHHFAWLPVETPVPVGFWRSVGHSHTAFVKETMIDQAARAAKLDPLQYRLRLLRDAPRHRAVLELAAEKAEWQRPLGPKQGRGIALHSSFGAIVAQVVEVNLSHGAPQVERVVCAADIGRVLNPNIATAQFEGAIVFALTAALHGEITLKNGAIEQGNYDDYPMLRLADTPPINVFFVASQASPGGAGEPGVPPLAPALANAIQAAGGQAITQLPVLRASA